MGSASFAGRSILIIEDEPLIVLDIRQELEKASAAVTSEQSIAAATPLIERN
jgi:hypothetical protein